MVVPLNGLHGKFLRFLVVDGKLLCKGNRPILGWKENNEPVYKLYGTQEEISGGECDKLILTRLTEFERQYGRILQGTAIDKDRVDFYVDKFTNTILIESASFMELKRHELHTSNVQYTRTIATLLHDFMVEYIDNYYDLYLYLFNKRMLMKSAYSVIRCHFLYGLYQPLVVESENIKSPLLYGENLWLYNALSPYEEYLERKETSRRHVNLSCIACCDLADLFGGYLVQELDRRDFMLVLCASLLNKLDPTAGGKLIARYPNLTESLARSPVRALKAGTTLSIEEENIRRKRIERHKAKVGLFRTMVNLYTLFEGSAT